MKSTASILLAALVLLLLPTQSTAGDYWLRFGGSFNFPAMSDFNDGVGLMNTLVEDAYRQDLLETQPGLSGGDLQQAVDRATAGNLLEDLDFGFGMSIAVARRMKLNTCVGLELERVMGTSDVIYNPTVAMNYSAPLTMTKVFLNTHIKEMGRTSLGVGGAVGWAQANGWLSMPANSQRTAMKDAYLTQGGLLLEGQLLAHYRIQEDFSVCVTLGYRLAKLEESDQNWFGASNVDPEPGEVELDESIPLQLDFSGFFVKTGIQVNLF